jgi:hypothetical protein
MNYQMDLRGVGTQISAVSQMPHGGINCQDILSFYEFYLKEKAI